LKGTKEIFGGGYLFILVGLLFKFVVAWFVPNGKGFEQNNLKLWAGFGRSILFLEQIMALSGNAQ
jgi:hypothetical protein